MKIPPIFGLYAILTDPVKGYEYMTRLLVDFEVPFIQLRMKNTPPEIILAMAGKLRAITAGTRSRFIINDHPAIAAKVNADGVHLGQEDLSFHAARDITGPDALPCPDHCRMRPVPRLHRHRPGLSNPDQNKTRPGDRYRRHD